MILQSINSVDSAKGTMPACCTRSVPYVADPSSFRRHYKQSGGALPIFHGLSHQDGYGVGGGIFSSLFRKVVPILKGVVAPALKKTAKAAGKTLLKSGTNVLSDIISGEKDIKSSLKQHGLEALREVGADVKKRVVTNVLKRKSQEVDTNDFYKAPPPKRAKSKSRAAVERNKKTRKLQSGGQFFL